MHMLTVASIKVSLLEGKLCFLLRVGLLCVLMFIGCLAMLMCLHSGLGRIGVSI